MGARWSTRTRVLPIRHGHATGVDHPWMLKDRDNELSMPVFIPQFGPFERPLKLQGFGAGSKPKFSPGKTPKPTPAPKPKPRPKTPPTPPGVPIPACYVSLNLHSFWPSSGVPSPAAVVALTPAAITAGCEVVLLQEENNATFGEYGYIVVIKVPAGPPPSTLFSVTTSGTRPTVPSTPPTMYCGTYTFERTVTLLGSDGGLFQYHIVWSYNDPHGVVDSGDTVFFDATPNLAAHTLIVEQFLTYDDGGGNAVNTGLPCGGGPSPSKKELEPFDTEVQVTLQEGHVVTPVIWPFSTTDAVRMPPYYGNNTAFWYGSNSSGAPGNFGLNIYDGVTVYGIVNSRWSSITRDTVPLVYVKSSSAGLTRYDAGGSPRARPQTPTPDGSTSSHFPWDTTTYGTFRMFVGRPPPAVSFDPLTDPA